jgi:hypothetical protein
MHGDGSLCEANIFRDAVRVEWIFVAQPGIDLYGVACSSNR